MSDRDLLIDALKDEIERLERGEADSGRLRELAGDDLIEVADLLPDLSDEEKLSVFSALEPEEQADVLEEADEEVQTFLLEHLEGDERLPLVLAHLAPDDAADMIEDLPPERRDRLLDGIDRAHAEAIRRLAQYPPDSAGGLMTPRFLAVPETATVQDTKNLIRSRADFETIGAIYVTRADGGLIGVFSARELILADNATRVSEILTPDVTTVRADADGEECYRVMETYHLASLPVVDEHHRLIGIVTVDDVLTIGHAEASEDVFRMAGSESIRPTLETVFGRARKRLPYLLVSVIGGFGSATVLKSFGNDVVSDVTYFLPLIAMLGGNIATQSSAVMVRGFATGEIDPRRIPRVVGDEMLVGLLVGAVCAACGGAVAFVLGEGDPGGVAKAVLVSIALLSGVSALLGTSIPSFCQRLGIDPAISAGPFITMLIDMCSCAIYMTFVLGFGAHLGAPAS